MTSHIELTETNAGVVTGWCNQRGGQAVMRGGPKGGSIGGTVLVRTDAAYFVIEPGDVVAHSPATGLYLKDAR